MWNAQDGYRNITLLTLCTLWNYSFTYLFKKIWCRCYKHLDTMRVFPSFYILPALSNRWFAMEINPDLRINVALHSCAHSSHWLWQAADGVLYSDLLLHRQGCSTFCEPFCSWIIDSILSVWLCRISHIVNWVERFGMCYVFLQGFLVFIC